MEKVMNLSYKGMAMVEVGKVRLIEKTKSIVLKKKDGGKGVLEESGLMLVAFAFLAIFLAAGNETIKDFMSKITSKGSSFMGGI